MSLALRLEDVRKTYGSAQVLNGVTYQFDRKGVYVLMGENGAGKSTLLRLCTLLETPDQGKVSYLSNGRALEHETSLRRRITLVLPKIGVFSTSVFNNVVYGLKVRGVEAGVARERVASALEFVGLSHKHKQNALTLSSGETQRLGIARAIVLRPEVLFLDEPAAFVDVGNREVIERCILKLREDGETTVVLTSHDRSQAERLADEMLLLHGGTVRRLR